MNPEEHMVADYAGTGMTATVRNPLKTRAKLREGNTSLKVEGESPDWPSDRPPHFPQQKVSVSNILLTQLGFPANLYLARRNVDCSEVL
jgi:hypothetical protein